MSADGGPPSELMHDPAGALQHFLVHHVETHLPVAVSVEEPNQPEETLHLFSPRQPDFLGQPTSLPLESDRNEIDCGTELC